MSETTMNIVIADGNKETGEALNRLAREQMKLKLMQDIRQDIQVCELEGLDYKEYLYELKEIIDGFIEKGIKR